MTDFQQANRCMVAKEYERAIELFLRHALNCPEEAGRAYASAAECYLQTNSLKQPAGVVPGVTLVFEGDRQGAEKYFRLALAADPSNVKALQGLSHLLPDRSEERRELLERAVATQPSTLSLIALGDYYRSQLRDTIVLMRFINVHRPTRLETRRRIFA